MARYLNEANLLDRDFAAAHVDGLAEYLAAADEWTLDRAAGVCGLTADDIAGFAEEYARTVRPSCASAGGSSEIATAARRIAPCWRCRFSPASSARWGAA